jgi:heme oxygenase
MTSNQSFLKHLKEKTREKHDAIGKLAFFNHLFNKKLTTTNFIYQLKSFAIIVSVLEHQMKTSSHRIIKNIMNNYQPRYPLIQKDLKFLDADHQPDHIVLVAKSLEIANKILERSASCPISLLGYFYVIEGSKLGGRILRKHYAKCLELSTDGLTFFSDDEEQIFNDWALFGKIMSQSNLSDEEKQDIETASIAFFDDLYELYTLLSPEKTVETGYHVTSINPEAGNHPIPTNAQEIIASIRAADICWQKFPYYQKRYAERGIRFARSDSAWLAAMVHLPQDELNHQIKWLTGLLAARGMPSITMQFHLEILHEELTKDIPNKVSDYQKLYESAKILKNERIKLINNDTMEELDIEFKSSLGYAYDKSFHDAGLLIISSVVDEFNGYKNAISSLKNWMTDPDRFSDIWIKAVEQLFQKVQGCLQAHSK